MKGASSAHESRTAPPSASRDATPMRSRAAPALGLFAAAWGALGLCALLVYAIARLGFVVAAGLEAAWQPWHVAVALANAVFMAWSEGYRGFQLGFSPRSAARVKWLRHNPNLVRTVLAPLFVMGYFNAPPRRLVAVWALTAAIVVAIVVIHALAQPLRAALDIGVVLGLTWGLASFLISLKRTFAVAGYPTSPQVVSAEAASNR